jgi:hypothetical protein
MKPSLLRFTLPSLLLACAPLASAQVQLIAWWDFDNATATSTLLIDPRGGVAAQIRNGALPTDPGGGRTGTGADRAMVFGTGTQHLFIPDGSFFNQAAAGDAVTVSFWQNLTGITSLFNLFVTSPSSSEGGRGFSSHVPWGEGTVYFDSAGCCGPTQRINAIPTDSEGNPVAWTGGWRHILLIKNGDLKEVYIDGIPGPTGTGADPLPADFTTMFIGNGPGLGNGVNGAIDDFAVFAGALDGAQIAALAGGASPASLVGPIDTDADGISDAYEYRFFPGDLTKLNGTGDFDTDGLPDLQEFVQGTNASDNDTDGDGALDGAETNTGTFVSATNTGTHPLIADTDNDRLPDGVENPLLPYLNATQTGTSPHVVDTDGDTFPDGVEVLYATSNPRNPASRPLRPALLDIVAYWPFNNDTDPAAALDAIKGFAGVLQNGAVYSADGTGRTGQPGDKAIDLGFTAGADTAVRVADGGFLNLGAAQDEIAVSFWQQLNGLAASSSFWGESALSSGRGINGHATYSDGTFYWDSAGCCGADTRLSAPSPVNLSDPPDWHHIVLQKKGATKEIWLDGTLVTSSDTARPLPLDFTVLHIGSDAGTANITGLIDDFVIYADALTQEQIEALAQGAVPTSIVPPSSDTDGDGMDDAFETANGLNPNVDDSLGDLDSDGMTNFAEYLKNTKPNNPDTDGDGVRDGAETDTGLFVDLNNRGTNPLAVDSDADGLADGVENPTLPFVDQNQPGTSPANRDSDGDNVGDGLEIRFGSNPTLASSTPLNPAALDLLAFWPFDDATDPAKAVDVHRSLEATVSDSVIYTDGGGGRTGGANDRSLDYGMTQGTQAVTVMGAEWLNLASSQNQMAVSFWQNLHQVTSSTVVKMASPSSTGTERGFSAHATWSDNNFYFDTAGCCDGATQRVFISIDAYTTAGLPEGEFRDALNLVGTWNHFVLQKNGDSKEIWVNGVPLLIGTNTGPLPVDFTNLFIGTGINTESILGYLDDFAIFADALTPDQIARLAAGESPLALLSGAPAPALAFSAVSFNPATSQITLTWNSQPGKTYTLRSTQTLASWPVELNDNIASGGATTTYVHTITTFPGGAPAALYYRIEEN